MLQKLPISLHYCRASAGIVFKPLKKLSFWFCKFLIVPKKITQASLCSSDFSQHVLSKCLRVVYSKETGILADIL